MNDSQQKDQNKQIIDFAQSFIYKQVHHWLVVGNIAPAYFEWARILQIEHDILDTYPHIPDKSCRHKDVYRNSNKEPVK